MRSSERRGQKRCQDGGRKGVRMIRSAPRPAENDTGAAALRLQSRHERFREATDSKESP